VHKIIVAHSSDFFKSLLSTNFREKDAPRVELKYEGTGVGCKNNCLLIFLSLVDTNKVFPMLLRYMYEGMIDITESTVIPLLAMADHVMTVTAERRM